MAMPSSSRFFRVGLLATFLCFVFALSTLGQDAVSNHKRLTNQDIINLVKTGVSEDIIIAKIRAASATASDSVSFDTTIDGLKALKDANVPDSVVKVMINPASAPTAVVAGSSPVALDPNLPPPEVGVYWKDGPNFILIQGQAVTNAKVGGKAGSFFTQGMRNQHWDAYLEGTTSKNVIKDRGCTFYFYVPDGGDSSDYALIKLNKKSNHREFQIGSFGGITGGKSGVKRDKEVAIKAEHVGIRTYRVILPEVLQPGEYGFFMGTGQSSTMSSGRGGSRSGGAASGRIYDFTIPE
jgi:hypothetical protein